MSLSLHMPRNLHMSRLAAHGRHRGKTPMQLRREVDVLTAQVHELQRQFDAAAVDYSGALEDKRAAEETAKSLAGDLATAGDEIRSLRAQLANARRMNVAPGYRDTSDPQDVATQPIPAGDMWTNPGRWKAPTGQHRVVPLPQAVDDTGQIPRPDAA